MLIDINKVIVSESVSYDCESVQNLAGSINKYGLICPIVIDKNYNLIDGARRLLACKQLGWSVIIACVVESEILDESTKRELGIDIKSPVWTPKMLRKIFPKPNHDGRKPCFICGDHKHITETHYLVQLSELARLINRGIVDPKNITNKVAWLCPNCHTYVHAIMRGDIGVGMDVYTSPKWRARYEELNDHRLSLIGDLLHVRT